MISLHDTLTGEVRPLETREPGRVTLYACGPTVYDHPHLGHARSALTYDVLRRYLEWRGLDVRHVSNVTDIDDKIIDRAAREGRTEGEVAAEWENVYVESMSALGMLAPHERPRATEWVGQMVELIEAIMDAGGAYATAGGVYLRVRGVPGYGDLVHRGLDELRASAGARVEVDEAKEDPLDFALWKAAKPGEPAWPSPWGPGRPGWHIECAAMSLGILGDGFDVHGGGNDLVFPHHTNERAEALAAGRAFARHWMHNAMLNIDGHKMAKSLANYRTVREMLAEHPLNARAFRLLVLQTHYRKTMEVNTELLAAARTAVRRLDALARRASAAAESPPPAGPPHSNPAPADGPTGGLWEEHPRPSPAPGCQGLTGGLWEEHPRPSPAPGCQGLTGGLWEEHPRPSPAPMNGPTGGLWAGRSAQPPPDGRARVSCAHRAQEGVHRFREAMDNDQGTPEAVAVIFDMLHAANSALDEGDTGASTLVESVIEMAGALGLSVEAGGQGADADADAPIEDLVAKRRAAREAKDWATADALRAELSSLGVTVEDTPAGPVWHRV